MLQPAAGARPSQVLSMAFKNGFLKVSGFYKSDNHIPNKISSMAIRISKPTYRFCVSLKIIGEISYIYKVGGKGGVVVGKIPLPRGTTLKCDRK